MNKDTRHLVVEIEQLRTDLLAMGRLAEERVAQAMGSLVRRDAEALETVIGGDARVDRVQVEIDHRCFTLLALQQPVATDLRTVVAALKIATDLERVADLAVNIAEAGLRYLRHPPVKPLVDLPRMATLAVKMLNEALDAFVRRDVALAHGVLRQDDWLDGLRGQIFRETLTFMLSQPRRIEPATDLILISRHLERIGDHATNIAEDVIFMVSGRDVRHGAHRAAPDDTGERRRGTPVPIL